MWVVSYSTLTWLGLYAINVFMHFYPSQQYDFNIILCLIFLTISISPPCGRVQEPVECRYESIQSNIAEKMKIPITIKPLDVFEHLSLDLH